MICTGMAFSFITQFPNNFGKTGGSYADPKTGKSYKTTIGIIQTQGRTLYLPNQRIAGNNMLYLNSNEEAIIGVFIEKS